MKISKKQMRNAKKTGKCHICEMKFEEGEKKVRDHDHYSSKFIGMAHVECNVLRTRQKKLNIYCHNGSAFDFHFLISGKLEDERIRYLDGLPDSQERLRLLRINDYVVKDSFAFLSE